MTSLPAEAVIYREGLISIIKNRGNHSSHFTKDRKIKWEDKIFGRTYYCRVNRHQILLV